MSKMIENMSDHAVFIDLNTHIFGVDRKLSDDLYEVEVDDEVKQTQTKALKRILTAKSHANIRKLRGQLRRRLKRLGFVTSTYGAGAYILPIDMIEPAEELLTDYSKRWDEAVSIFLAEYPKLIEESREKLGPLFDPINYPSDKEIRGRFYLTWGYTAIGDAPAAIKRVSAKVFDRERKKASRRAERTMNEIRDAMRNGFVELVERMVERLTPNADGKKKVFQDAFINSFNEFLDVFAKRNLAGDTDLERLVKNAKSLLEGVDPKRLRKDKDLRDVIKEGFDKIQEVMKTMVTSRSRMIRFEDEKAA